MPPAPVLHVEPQSDIQKFFFCFSKALKMNLEVIEKFVIGLLLVGIIFL